MENPWIGITDHGECILFKNLSHIYTDSTDKRLTDKDFTFSEFKEYANNKGLFEWWDFGSKTFEVLQSIDKTIPDRNY
jgi:hypothetical protein